MFKNFPLRNHRFAHKAALAALAAHRQGRFWEFHDLLFQNYNRLNDQKIQEISLQLGLDQVAFQKNIKDPQIRAMVQRDMADGAKAGLKGTPTVFLNGKLIRSMDFKRIQQAVDAALKQRGKVPKTGAGEKE